ncbi:transposase, partial [uncultured Jannaschia sp.]|uniref:transposase n=1 Tax=uncultured Jannaschia sp. TaxID=293347 RepID=UPI0026288EBA
MPNETHHRVEVITGLGGRRYWPAREKLRIIEESLVPGESVFAVARRNGVAPNLLFRWRRLMDEGDAMAVESNEPVVGASEVRKLEDRVRDLEHLLGRKTIENEILREALVKAGQKKQMGPLKNALSAACNCVVSTERCFRLSERWIPAIIQVRRGLASPGRHSVRSG